MREVRAECHNGDDVLDCFADLTATDEESFGKASIACALLCDATRSNP